MSKNFAVIGGDERIIYLAQMLSEDKENVVYTFGHELYKKTEMVINKEKYIECDDIEKTLENAEIVISSIPFSKDDINVYAPFHKEVISIRNIFKYGENKTLYAGGISSNLKDVISLHMNIVDLMKYEDLTILNTIATAEGTISEIIQNTKINIHGSKILILGFGRVAKTLALKLLGLNAEVTCAARKIDDYAWMEAYGIKHSNINILREDLRKYDVIINTVPKLILKEELLMFVNKDTLLIDLASRPGGIDKEACEKFKLKFIWTLAIPGKVAPLTSAKYIKNTIDNIIEGGIGNRQ